MMYRTKSIAGIRSEFEQALKTSQEITVEQMKKTNIFVRMLRGVLHVLMPLA
ncbi:MAG: hypothetical protein LKH21_06805 [Solobacterium sp.]|jgi:hypothetical protein|nr:hypothetical protein [Solobacterium sp.]